MSQEIAKKSIGIGFGTWSWGNKLLWGYSSDKDDDSLKETFKVAVLGGLDFIDTADSYGTGKLNGRSEQLLGQFIQDLSPKQRSKIIIATKLAPFPWRLGRQGFNKAFRESRERLKGNLDRVQLHWSTYRYAPWQETSLIDGLGDLVEKGYIKEIGVSNFGPNRLRWLNNKLKQRGIKLKSVQIQFSLLSPLAKRQISIQNTCKELNIELIAYSPLALGVLAVQPDKKKINRSFLRNRIFEGLLPSSYQLRKSIEEIAHTHSASQAQVALNWCRAHGAIPIPGIRSVKQAKDASEALRWELTLEERDYLDKQSELCQNLMPQNPFSCP